MDKPYHPPRSHLFTVRVWQEELSTVNHIFDPGWPDDGRWTMDDAPPSIVYRLSSKAGTLLRFAVLSQDQTEWRGKVQLITDGNVR